MDGGRLATIPARLAEPLGVWNNKVLPPVQERQDAPSIGSWAIAASNSP